MRIKMHCKYNKLLLFKTLEIKFYLYQNIPIGISRGTRNNSSKNGIYMIHNDTSNPAQQIILIKNYKHLFNRSFIKST